MRPDPVSCPNMYSWCKIKFIQQGGGMSTNIQTFSTLTCFLKILHSSSNTFLKNSRRISTVWMKTLADTQCKWAICVAACGLTTVSACVCTCVVAANVLRTHTHARLLVCAAHMISRNNWYETWILPTEFADASWRNKALLLHWNVSSQHVCVCVCLSVCECEGKVNNLVILGPPLRSNSPSQTLNVLCMTSCGTYGSH